MKSDSPNIPDFLIIGAMKCATSTLHDQLAEQPGFFMSTPKEPNFFSDDDVYQKGEQWYSDLFAGQENKLRGESSTHYTKLPTYPRTIERMKQYGIKNPKLIYVMRHPIDRLVSHYIHEWSQGIISCGIDEALERHPELIQYSKYYMQLEPYAENFSPENILPIFFEHVRDQPQTELERICAFLGYSETPQWNFDMGNKNVSAERIRKFKGYNLLVESPLACWLRRSLIPQSFRNQVKNKLTMQERPTLSESAKKRLVETFDADLENLEKFIGAPVNCDNFGSQRAPVAACA